VLSLLAWILAAVLAPPAHGAAFATVPLAARRAALERGNLVREDFLEPGRWKLDGARVERAETGGRAALVFRGAPSSAARLVPDEASKAARAPTAREISFGRLVPNEASKSARAPTARETSRASAQIEVPVIPGEHLLSAMVRLSGIEPAPGERVCDRFRVRVTWLDARRRPLPAPAVRAFARAFPPGEKPFPLYFLREAPRTREGGNAAWRRAIFVAGFDDPSHEDAPEGSAFARITFTLRGAGEAAIRDVRFRYTRRNFTLAERVAPFARLDDDRLGRVIPAPRFLEERGAPIPIRALCLDLPKSPPAPLADRAAAFARRLNDLGARVAAHGEACDARVRVEPPHGGREEASVRALARAEGPEGYAIATTLAPAARPSFVLAGADARGAAYAVETLRQLLREGPRGGAALRAVTVRDRPAFRGRPISEADTGAAGARRAREASRWAAEAKLNRIYLNYPIFTPRWWEPPRAARALVASLAERARETGLYDLGVLFNPYFQRSDPAIRDTFQVSRASDVNVLWESVRAALDAGARIIALCADDFTPSYGRERLEYALTDRDDRRRFGSIARAHVTLVRSIRERIRARAPGAALLFVPPWYNEVFRELGGGYGEDYLEDIGRDLPRDVGIVWTGPAVRSLAVDGLSVGRFSGAVGRRPIVLWDNTLYAIELSPYYGESPERAPLASFFEPFAIESDDLSEASFRGEIYVNGQSGGRYRVKLMTVADFLWNPDAYDPDRSLWRAMKARWGRRGAGLAVAWDAAYWNERLWINRLAWTAQGGFDPASVRAGHARARARTREAWGALVAALRGRDDDLLADLAGTMREQEARAREASGLAERAP
jgi:hypothetical protein